MIKFHEWLKKHNKNFTENLWGNIPSTSRKPSDGPVSKVSFSSNQKGKTAMNAPLSNQPLQGKMKK